MLSKRPDRADDDICLGCGETDIDELEGTLSDRDKLMKGLHGEIGKLQAEHDVVSYVWLDSLDLDQSNRAARELMG